MFEARPAYRLRYFFFHFNFTNILLWINFLLFHSSIHDFDMSLSIQSNDKLHSSHATVMISSDVLTAPGDVWMILGIFVVLSSIQHSIPHCTNTLAHVHQGDWKIILELDFSIFHGAVLKISEFILAMPVAFSTVETSESMLLPVKYVYMLNENASKEMFDI